MMKMGFFLKLALSGMKKNGKLYLPYIFTCIGMVMMSYILQSLSYSPLLKNMRGGGSVEMSLSLGKFVVAVFALIFLLYTNSFLVRRRNREFGLYHILGMGKRGIRRIIFWESLIVALLGMAFGLVFGVVFSKMAELILANILHAQIDYSFTLEWESILWTLMVYGVIFGVLLINSLITVQRTKPLELLHSENLGEKPPKANWLIALVGVVLLAGAYYLAVSIQSPLSALVMFFVAVIMVIVATYLLFIAGSVVFCRILQKNKKYYYRKQHFVSVSSMVFRMKRNGAGLASICVLSTMVLVMLSSTSGLYFGMEDTINRRYPRECAFSVEAPGLESLSEENVSIIRKEFDKIASAHKIQMSNVLEYNHADITGLFTEDGVNLDSQSVDSNEISVMDYLRQIVFVGAEDYNRITGSDIHPVEGETYCLPVHCTYEKDRIIMGALDLQVKGILTGEFPIDGNISASVVPYILFVVPDLSAVSPLMSLKDYRGEQMLSVRWNYAYDLPGAKEEEIIEVFQAHKSKIMDMEFFKVNDGFSYSLSCRVQEKADFLNTFGGMFFLGIILSLVFISAAVLIIYYKQISEGYEDQARFEIMQKVGMTGEDIKKSINSQVLTVFFAPLLLAGIHLVFAYPMIWKILQLFFMRNLAFVVLVTIGDFILFGIFYAIVYKLTAGAYYNIVSGGKKGSG